MPPPFGIARKFILLERCIAQMKLYLMSVQKLRYSHQLSIQIVEIRITIRLHKCLPSFPKPNSSRFYRLRVYFSRSPYPQKVLPLLPCSQSVPILISNEKQTWSMLGPASSNKILLFLVKAIAEVVCVHSTEPNPFLVNGWRGPRIASNCKKQNQSY